MATLKNLVDETTNIKNELVACHSNLKNNLVAKGVECSDSDKMSNLIDKINDIVMLKAVNVGTSTTLFYDNTSYSTPSNSSTGTYYKVFNCKINTNLKVESRTISFILYTSGTNLEASAYITVNRGGNVVYTSEILKSNNTSVGIEIDVLDLRNDDVIEFWLMHGLFGKAIIKDIKVTCEYLF